MIYRVMQISEEEISVSVERFAEKTGVAIVVARFAPFLVRDVEGHVVIRFEIHRSRYDLEQLEKNASFDTFCSIVSFAFAIFFYSLPLYNFSVNLIRTSNSIPKALELPSELRS